MPLIAQLPNEPLAIIGDVHGEREALHALLTHLGYGAAVQALKSGLKLTPQQRGEHFLVFVGDLVDRGPDSPGVVEDVLALCDANWAVCVLGNHEINLIVDTVHNPRGGTRWFAGETETFQHGGEAFAYASIPATPDQRNRFAKRLNTFPLAAIRKDIRVVHAAWDDTSIQKLKTKSAGTTILEQRDFWSRTIADELRDLKALGVAEMDGRDETRRVKNHPQLPAIHELPSWIEAEEREQNEHPLKHLSSGPERGRGTVPIYIDHKYRYLDRHPWWHDYTGQIPVVVGHYWRLRDIITGQETHVLNEEEPLAWLGPKGLVFCVDYSAGRRYEDRATCLVDNDKALAAILWPALGATQTVSAPIVVFDDGVREETTGFGGGQPVAPFLTEASIS